MNTKIKKWGNSQGIRIPKAFLETLDLASDDSVEIFTEQDKIIIKKVSESSHLKIEDRLQKFYGNNLEDSGTNLIETQKEMDWGKPVGKEIW